MTLFFNNKRLISRLTITCLFAAALCASVQGAVHTATEGIYITHIPTSLVPARPDMVLMVTPLLDGAGPRVPDPVGVWFDPGFAGFGPPQWTLYTQNLASIPAGAKFSVLYFAPDGTHYFVHRASSSNTNTAGTLTYIDSPVSNNSPQAIVHVTPEFSPNNSGFDGYLNTQIETWYDSKIGRWAVANQDGSRIPDGMRLHVVINPEPSSEIRTSFIASPLFVSSDRVYLGRSGQDFNVYGPTFVDVQVTARFSYDPTSYACPGLILGHGCDGLQPGDVPQFNQAMAAQYDYNKRQWFITAGTESPIPPYTTFTVSVFTYIP